MKIKLKKQREPKVLPWDTYRRKIVDTEQVRFMDYNAKVTIKNIMARGGYEE